MGGLAWIALPLVLAGLAAKFGWELASALRLGVVRTFARSGDPPTFYREREPASFWAITGAYAVGVLVLLAGAAFVLVRWLSLTAR